MTLVPAAQCHQVSHKTQGYHRYRDNLIDLAVRQEEMSFSTAKTKGPEHLQASGVLIKVCQGQPTDAFFWKKPHKPSRLHTKGLHHPKALTEQTWVLLRNAAQADFVCCPGSRQGWAQGSCRATPNRHQHRKKPQPSVSFLRS